jgi:hypothetical protein
MAIILARRTGTQWGRRLAFCGLAGICAASLALWGVSLVYHISYYRPKPGWSWPVDLEDGVIHASRWWWSAETLERGESFWATRAGWRVAPTQHTERFGFVLPDVLFTPDNGGRGYVRAPLWWLFLMSGCIAYMVRPRREQLANVCKKCEYDLTGNGSGRCPECGTSIGLEEAVTIRDGAGEIVASSVSETESIINVDLPCAGCWYNLRTLARTGSCPECGLAISSSLNSERLIFADRDWLIARRGWLSAATGFLTLAVLTYLAFAIQFLNFSSPFGAYAAPGWTSLAVNLALLWWLPVLGAGFCLWRFAGAAPNEGPIVRRRWTRPILRMSAIAAVATSVISTAWALSNDSLVFPLRSLTLAAPGLGLAVVALLAYLGELAGRLPLRRRAFAIRICCALTVVCVTALTVIWVILNEFMGWWSSSSWMGDAPINCVINGIGIALVGIAIGWTSLRYAERHWVAHSRTRL